MPLIGSLVACGATLRPTPYTAPYDPSQRAAYWDRTFAVLWALGYAPESVDEVTGLIATGWLDAESVPCHPPSRGDAKAWPEKPDCHVRDRLAITVASGGVLRVAIERRLRAPGHDAWFAPVHPADADRVESDQFGVYQLIRSETMERPSEPIHRTSAHPAAHGTAMPGRGR